MIRTASVRDTLLERAERIAQLGVWEFSPESGRLIWSDNLFRLLGLERGLLPPTLELLLSRIHPDDRLRVADAIERVGREGRLTAFEHRIVRPDGSVRHLQANVILSVSEAGGRRRIIGSVSDVTERRRAEQEIAAHVAVSEALVEWESYQPEAEGTLRRLAGAVDLALCVLWVPRDDVLVARRFWRVPALEAPEFERLTRTLRLPRGAGLPGRAWSAGVPVVAEVPGDLEGDGRLPAAVSAGLRGGVALPAVRRGEVLAVLEFYAREALQLSARTLAGEGSDASRSQARGRADLQAGAVTSRELEVLQLASEGRSREWIAEQLVVSPATVKTHLEHIYSKLGVPDRAAAVAEALRHGLIQ